MRFLCVILSFFMLAIGVVMAVVDATRTIAAREWVFTPLIDSWRSTMPGFLDWTEASLESGSLSFLWDPLMLAVLQLPGWAVFAVLAFLLHAASWRRKRQEDFAHSYR